MIRIKKSGVLILLALIFTFNLFTTVAYADEKSSKEETKVEGMDVEAKSALLMEVSTGKILYNKNSNEKFAPASVTKIMTMLITMEEISKGKIKFEDKVTVSETAKKMGGSTMLLDTGEVRTVEELIKGIAIASGNDAAVAMAEYIGGTEEGFVNIMNERCAALGMKDTTFKNCTGLPVQGHLTTAYDISIMSRELLKYPDILKYTGTYMETISEGRKTPIGLVNHNKLVRFFNGCDGLKTGYTEEAHYCISATAVKDGVRVLAVIMGAPTYKVRNKDASMLMNYGFSKFEKKDIVQKDEDIDKVVLDKSGEKYFIAKSNDELSIVIEKGKNVDIKKEIVIDKDRKEYNKGDIIGYCQYYAGEEVVGKVDIYSDRDLKRANFIDNMKYNLKNLFKGSI
ncbi:D-alanyl-D-alanine carboxypeptidase family protein [Clostridium amazonitimonense]|uniref:D-alanyl-D-alanine carboxypeptidase family protein n=1 Tax=Clostridium amazonitimonense TaxID=1499689 RepID=UPI0005099549|nr:D-alanyl-D-alanine carboxypeptidase family protein [Clostridium amazonitimonense]